MVSLGLQRKQPALPAHTTSPRHDLDLGTLTSGCAGLRQCTMPAGCHKCSIELPVDPGGGWRGKCCEDSLFRVHEGRPLGHPHKYAELPQPHPVTQDQNQNRRYKGEV